MINRKEELIYNQRLQNMKYNFKKNITKALAVSMIAAMMLTGCGGKTFATVNGEDVSQESYENYLNFTYATIEETYGKDMLDNEIMGGKTGRELIKEQVREDFPRQEIFRQYAEKNNIKIDEKEFEKNMKAFKDSYEKQHKDKKFSDFLKSAGLKEKDFEEIMKGEMLKASVMEKLMEDNAPTDQEIQEYYDQNKDNLDTVTASHILVDTEEEAKEISDAIKNGAAFEDYLERSKDEASKAQNGSVGEFPRHGMMVEEFSAAAFGLQPGEVSDPVKSEFGYHIIKVDDKKEGFDAVKENIAEELKYQKAVQEMEKIVSEAKVEYTETKDDKKEDKKEDKKDDSKKEDKAENKEESKPEESAQPADENQQNGAEENAEGNN